MSSGASPEDADVADEGEVIKTHRLESFSDGVMAVIITLMALE